MISYFRKSSIRSKLRALVALSAGIALAAACAGFTLYEMSTYQEEASGNLVTLADILAGTLRDTVALKDPRAADEALGTLRNEGHILRASVYLADGTFLAAYSRNGVLYDIPTSPGKDGLARDGSSLCVFRPVVLQGGRIGTVFVRRDLEDIRAVLRSYVGIAAIVFAIATLLAVWIASYLQRYITSPLYRLTRVAGRVSREQDYTIRARTESQDEIGVLVSSFNSMLEQIQKRDEALQSARNDLEDRVEERTAELQAEIAERRAVEAKVIAAKELAVASNQAKSMFLANMSHELRTPLNAIVGYCEILLEDAEAAEQAEAIADLNRVLASAKHLLALIEDVLDLSKIEAGFMNVNLQSVSVGAALDEVAGMAVPLARRRGNRFEVICADQALLMRAEPVRFRQALLNLLSNACTFTDHGKIRLEVRQAEAEGRQWVEWAVSDTGIGIAPRDFDKLFKPFSQVDGSATRKYGGTGLGLALSQNLCKMMGGTILVESQEGVGSTFTIRMPAASWIRSEERLELESGQILCEQAV
jgi:signal transduction histidine kinase